MENVGNSRILLVFFVIFFTRIGNMVVYINVTEDIICIVFISFLNPAND